ncbi:MAG: PQQ-binding-like beta-propeller repeat protein [Planctomycetota bacterium]|nr:PQQ-binding-like beta-propeller repeat protein [Planctomycetota bacterium]MDA1211315.1 PQQ-binding-like beta-propeller repeat protein [Planctomycetota bacterium]
MSILLFGVDTYAVAGDWTQFRGPNATGVSTDPEPLPTEFSTSQNLLFSHELGVGIACPVITNGKVITTAYSPEAGFVVYCHDAADGSEIWKTKFDIDHDALPKKIVPPNEHASSTPCTDGERVYIYFSAIGLLALDLNDGSQLWSYSLPMPYYLMDWGPATSPIVYEDMVIYCQDDDLDQYLIALDKKTGTLIWRTPRPEMLGGYAVPVLCTANGRTDIVTAGSGKMQGFDPATGEEIWSCNSLLRTTMSTPVVKGDKIYATSQSYGDAGRILKEALMEWKDTNQDKKLAKDELEKPFWPKFEKADTNGDGFLIQDEIDTAFQAPTNLVGGGNIIQCIQGGGTGDVTATHLLWNLDHKAPSNISSPLIVDGRMFVVKKSGISAAFDEVTGETIWMQKRIRNLGDYFASPIAGDGKIYVTGENGFMIVLKQGPELEILAKNDMEDTCIATPAISDGRIYVRTLKKLHCFAEGAGAGQ